MRRVALLAALSMGLGLAAPLAAQTAPTPTAGAQVHVEMEGVPFEDTAIVAGQKLVLNGVAVHKRAFFKTEVVGLYLTERMRTPEAILKSTGPKRLRMVILRDVPGHLVSRYFVNDFKRWATEEEFKQLINEVGQVGGHYAAVKKLLKGDEVLIDWVPGVGIVSSINGKSTGAQIRSELFFTITVLRPGLSPNSPTELRERITGALPMPTAPGPYPGPVAGVGPGSASR